MIIKWSDLIMIIIIFYYVPIESIIDEIEMYINFDKFWRNMKKKNKMISLVGYFSFHRISLVKIWYKTEYYSLSDAMQFLFKIISL